MGCTTIRKAALAVHSNGKAFDVGVEGALARNLRKSPLCLWFSLLGCRRVRYVLPSTFPARALQASIDGL